MFSKISPHLNLAYDIIKIIHKLYIKYAKFIKVDSFESCGKGIDTIYNIIQSKIDGPISLYIKLHVIKKYDDKPINKSEDLLEYILFLPISVITPIGVWKFVDNPRYIINNIEFSLELIKLFNLKFIYQSYYDNETFIFYDPIFVPTKVIDTIYLINYEKYKNLDIRYLFNIFDTKILKELSSINENRHIYFNDFILGPDICTYSFNIFLNKLFTSSEFKLSEFIFDDHKLYYKYFIDNKCDIKIFNIMKTYFNNKNIYGYDKKIYNAIFYYTYLNYFGTYDKINKFDKIDEIDEIDESNM